MNELPFPLSISQADGCCDDLLFEQAVDVLARALSQNSMTGSLT